MERLKWPEGEPIEAKMVTKAVENAQKQIEELNYERRKNVLKYDEVMNGQREVIYAERRKILEGQSLKEQALGFVEDVVRRRSTQWAPADAYPDDWDRDGLLTALGELFPVHEHRGGPRRHHRGSTRWESASWPRRWPPTRRRRPRSAPR